MTRLDDCVPVVAEMTLHRGTSVVVGLITAGQLVDGAVIPRRDHRRKTGYQREPGLTRVARLAIDLQNGRVDLPTALLLNIREAKARRRLRRTDGGLRLDLSGADLYVVDGQHRVEALRRLLDRDEDRWAPFMVAFVCMLGATYEEEMRQFYVVNSTAKGVRTDLAFDLLKQQAESDPELLNALIERGEDWKVKAQALTEEMEASPAWVGRIRFPGAQAPNAVISSSSFATSLKPLLSTAYFGGASRDKQAEILDAYWKGIRSVLPEAFDAPAQFTLQKTTGITALHAYLISVIELARSRGMPLLESETYATLLEKPLLELEGDTGEGDPATGLDFWRSGGEGAAGSFSSNAGRRVLVAKLRNLLPAVEVE